MAETTRLSLPLIAAGQAQKHVTANEAFARLDALSQIELVEVDAVTPPVSPADGDCYGVGAGASGAWAGQDGTLASFVNGGWIFVTPRTGWSGWVASQASLARFDGVAWVAGAGALSANGAGFVHRTIEIDHAIGAGATSSLTGFIPANTVVYGITGRVITAIGGASSLSVGVAGSTDRYGSGIGTGAGSWLRGLTGQPQAYYADEDIVLTAAGGNFDGSGVLRLAVHFAELTLPRA